MSNARDMSSEVLVDRALGRVFRIVQRLRFFGTAVLGTLGVLFIVYDEPWWKAAIALPFSVVLGYISVRDVRRRREVESKRDIARLLLSIQAAQLVAVTLTGGIRSPILLVVPPMLVGVAIATGRIDLLRPAAALLMATILVLGLGDALGWWPPEALVPVALRRFDDGAAVGYIAVLIVAFFAISTASAMTGVYVRRAFRVALDDALAARAEVIEATRTKHRELEALSGALAHELKNPLASISGLAGLLARKLPEGSKEAERMDVLLGEVKRMILILDEFLNFSRPAEGLTVSDFAAADLVRDVLALHEGAAAKSRVRLVADIESTARLHADPRKLKQVLINLVQNALEVSPADASVTVRVSDLGARAVAFDVDDEGGGLAPAIIDRLFKAGATTKPAGTGLGLVIARGITEQHGGELTLENLGRGCRARVVIPRVPDVATAIGGVA